jgi:pimeloyl-ACP methyl ester carboxylesterase
MSLNTDVYENPVNKGEPPETVVMLIGGFFDSFLRIVKGYAEEYRNNNSGRLVEYFSWTDKDEIISAINSTPSSKQIFLVGHSFGAHTAAQVAAGSSRRIDLLVTVDPVGRRDVGKFTQNVDKWINVTATPANGNLSDFVAWLGGKGGGLPVEKAALNFSVDANHEQFAIMFNTTQSGEQSAAQTLQGSTV